MLPSDEELQQLADDYVHELLPPAEEKAFEQSCAESASYREALREARARFGLLASLPPCEPSEALVDGTITRYWMRYAHPRPVLYGRVARVFWTICGLAAAVLVVLNIYFATLAPSPFDLRVFGQGEFLADTSASLRVCVLHHKTKKPVEGVPVEVALLEEESQREVQLASFSTDARGTGSPRLRLPDWPNGQYELKIVAKTPRQPEIVTRIVKLKRSWKLMLTTDKPVYQPGQVMRLRSLALRRPDLEPIAGREAIFAVSDAKGNVIFKQKSVTSRFGISSAECALAKEIIEGAYTIRCTLDDTTSERTVEVKKYTLPKFKVDVTLDRTYYSPGDMMRGDVAARYFFDKPVAGAEIQIEVETTDAETKTIGQLSVRADETGRGQFEFRIPDSLVGRGYDSGDAELRVNVTLRDSAGQQLTRHLRTLVTSHPLRIEVIPEAGTLVRGQQNRVYVMTTYADGQPAQTRIAVSNLDKELETNRLGVATFVWKPHASIMMRSCSFRAVDETGLIAQRSVQLKTADLDAFLLRTDKVVYEGGGTIELTVLGAGREPVFVDLLKDGQTVLTRSLDLKAGQASYQFDLPPDLFGTLELCAFRLGEQGPIRKTRVIYVRPADQLVVRPRLDKRQYRPGEKARLEVTLTDQEGQPVAGAVSLAAVDEAVYSVLSQRPGSEQSFFMVQNELLKPVAAIYPWSPDALRHVPPDQRREFEQALFARTGHGGRDEQLRRELIERLDGDERVLDVLNRPDWEDLIDDHAMFPEEMIQQLREIQGAGSPHSLSAATYPVKAQKVDRRRRSALEGMHAAWVVLGVLVVAGILAALLIAIRLVEFIAVTGIGLLLIGLLLPEVQNAREAGRRSSAINELRMLAFGLEMGADGRGGTQAAGSAPRVREWFPETLLWRPEVITDETGTATIEFDLADSITTWKLSASAVSGGGRLGAAESSIRVFQEFFVDLNLPVALTRGDEVSLPVVVYNYLPREQQVTLTFEAASGFELLDGVEQMVQLGPSEVRSIAFRVRATKVGRHSLQLTARGSDAADAIRRSIDVVPDGRRVEQVTSGTLDGTSRVNLQIPDDAINGSARALVKIYPTAFSQVVEGLDAVFQRPYGCFEQTSSTTYPNLLALDYLHRTGKAAPAVEAKARQYIHLGYQRLLSFEVDGGGFDWFGHPPAHRTLTAYGLMEFEDMARVSDVDPALLKRTRQWLLQQQRADGSWDPSGHRLHNDPTGHALGHARLATTAYIAWAVYSGNKQVDGQATLEFLLSHGPESIESPYVLALLCNALLALDESGSAATPYVERLVALHTSSRDGKQAWWSQRPSAQTLFYGAGRSGDIEATAMAALALIESGRRADVTRNALAWLVAQKDAAGTWHTTQATVLALKALLAGTGKPLGGEQERRIDILMDGQRVREVVIPADQGEVVQQVDLTEQLTTGQHALALSDRNETNCGYQVTLRYHVPQAEPAVEDAPLAIDLAYDRTELEVGGTIAATATLTNRRDEPAPMVILDLPIPAGLAVEPSDFAGHVAAGRIAKYQLTPQAAIVYLRELAPREPLQLEYKLLATMPVKVHAPPARAYRYYDPETKAASAASRLLVTADPSEESPR